MKLTVPHERIIGDPQLDVLFQPCAFHAQISIHREGLFRRLWNLALGSTEEGPGYEPLALRSWLPPSKERTFYRFLQKSRSSPAGPQVRLVVLYLDPHLCPLFLIEDYLKAYGRRIDFRSGPLECLLIPGRVTYERHTEYVHLVYRLLEDVTGQVPKFRSLESLLKAADLRDLSFAPIGVEWACADSFIEHLLLSKGARRAELAPRSSDVERVGSLELSMYHELELVSSASPAAIENGIEALRPICQKLRRITGHTDRIPDSFKALVYHGVEARVAEGAIS
jgi:hypothetical protein